MQAGRWQPIILCGHLPKSFTIDYAPLILKKNEERRLRAGHLWVFSNEVDATRTPLPAFKPGQPVLITAANGRALGSGYVNPHSLICARLLSRDINHPYAPPLIRQRLLAALALRERLFDRPYYRLVYGEGDGLPGLVVDRYGDILVIQVNTAGMDRMQDVIVDTLRDCLAPAGILLRNDSPARELEGLPSIVDTVHGAVPETIEIEENGCRFTVPMLSGQKTGWFYDHRLNRQRLPALAAGMRVLDVFSYLGAWGVQAAVGGAAHVTCVESSPAAVEFIQRNAALNGVDARLEARRADAFDALRTLRDEQAQFDVVILDPPAFIKRKKDMDKGSEAYRLLNQLALQVLGPDGMLVTASCSSYLGTGEFRNLLRQAAMHSGRFIRIIEQGHQGPDHPIHPAIPETEYLKLLLLNVLPAQ
jgi:23S rRNA (cytosine1962-C5)-methyltransferase